MRSSQREKFYTLLTAFLLPVIIFLLLLFRHHIVPFGETTLLISDLDTQYIEFMAEYRRILLGQGSLFWSWHAGLGMNFTALAAYYLASPFNFLLILFPQNVLPLAVTVLTTLKLGCSGAAFAYFIQTHHKNPEYLLIPVFSACYALSAYALGYAFNIMWLDAMIILPLLCAGIDRLIDTKRKAMTVLTLLLALSFLSQFYMAWMTGAFCALYFVTQILIRKIGSRGFLHICFRFFLCVGIAMGLSAFLLLPAFFVLKNNMGLIGQTFPDPEGQFSFFKIIPKLFLGSFDGVKDCLPHIYCGLPAIFGAMLYFTRKDIQTREKIISGLVTGFLLFSFWFKPLDFLWHAMDHPSWFPFRYAFVFCFWILSLAYTGFSGYETETLKKYFLIFTAAEILVLTAASCLQRRNFSFLLLNSIFLLSCAILNLNKTKTIRIVSLALAVSAELFINGNMIISDFSGGYTGKSDYLSFHEHYRKLTEAVLPKGNEFYRMEKNEYRNYNDPLGIGYPGISHFSSTASTRQAEFLKRLGFNCYATWCTYEGSTAASDALLGVRYEFWGTGKQDSLPVRNETLEHPSLLPLFFFADDAFARYGFFTENDAIKRQNDLLRLLAADETEEFFTPVPVNITRLENLKKEGDKIFFKVDSSQEAFFEAEIEPVENASLYLLLPGASLSHTVTVNGTELMNGNRDYAPFPICLDAFAPDGTIRIRAEAVKDRLEGGIEAYALDTARLSALCKTIQTAAPQMERKGSTSFILTADPAPEDRLIVSSIPFDAGWQIEIDGQKQPLKMIHESVLGFTLPAGCSGVEISYRPYGFEAGLILSGISLILLAAVIFYEKKQEKPLK